MALRGAMHRAGAAALTELLRTTAPVEMAVSCRCGHPAHYHQMRPKQLLTVLGRLEIERAYYMCPHCHQGQSPRDKELDVEGTECSPGVRRMMALVGSESSFEQSREQLELLAGIEVTAKAVERQAEGIGADIAAREDEEIRRAKQLELPEVCAPAVPILYIEMDGTGVPVVKVETEGRVSKIEGVPAHTREVKLGCVFTQTQPTRTAGPCAMKIPRPTSRPSRPPRNSACDSTPKPVGAAGAGPRRRRSSATAPSGSGVGSGVVEAGCKTVVATRLKRSGMFWTVRGANDAIIALRCCRLCCRFENYWEARSPAA